MGALSGRDLIEALWGSSLIDALWQPVLLEALSEASLIEARWQLVLIEVVSEASLIESFLIEALSEPVLIEASLIEALGGYTTFVLGAAPTEKLLCLECMWTLVVGAAAAFECHAGLAGSALGLGASSCYSLSFVKKPWTCKGGS
eukprot:1096343-Amphidinium_carterae.1